MNCKDCGKFLKLYENCTSDTMQEERCSDCYIIIRNPRKPKEEKPEDITKEDDYGYTCTNCRID